MKRFFALIGSFFLAALVHSQELEKNLPMTNFSGGLNTYNSPLTIQDNEVKSALDVLFDEDNAVTKRKGFTTCGSSSSYSYDSGWAYTDSANQSWLIVRSSDAIMAASSPCNFTVRIATVAANDLVNAVNAFGNIYFVDRTQGVYYWNGTATSYVSGSPKGNLIAEFRNRLWVAGLNIPNGNLLYGSKYLDGSTWATGSLAIDPVILTVGLNDNFDNVSALFSGYNDTLTLFKARSIYALYGFDQSDFSLRILNREVGCMDQRSIQPFMGGLVFLSQRGFEFFDGLNATWISKGIKNLVDPSTLASLNLKSWTENNEADFSDGASVPTGRVSSTVLPGYVTVSTFGVTPTTDADFNAGTHFGTESFNGSVHYSTNSYGLTNRFDAGFESTTGWTFDAAANRVLSTTNKNCTTTPSSGSYFLDVARPTNGNTIRAELVECSGSTVLDALTIPFAQNSCTWTIRYLTESNARRSVKLRIQDTTTATTLAVTACFLETGQSIEIATATDGYAFPPGELFKFDNLIVTDVQPESNTYRWTSPAYDTTFSSSIVKIESVSMTIDDITPTFGLQHSTSSSGPWANLTTTVDGNDWANRYLRVISTFPVVSTSDGLSTLDAFTLVARSTGSFYSEVNYSPNLSSWGLFTAQKQDNGGTHTFYMRSSTSPFTVTSSTPTWTAATSGAQVPVSTGAYKQVRDDFTITAATSTPSLDFFRVEWYEGVRRPPMASAIYDNRYWVSLTTSTSDSQNSATLVLSKGPVWSLFSISAGAYILYKGNLYHAGNSSNGKVYTDWQGYNDDGAAINAYFQTKDYMPDGWMTDKLVKSLHLLAEPLGAYGLNSWYEVDRSGTLYPFSPITVDELSGKTSMNLAVPASTSYAPFGKSLSVKFGNSTVDQPMKVYGGSLVYEPRPIMQ